MGELAPHAAGAGDAVSAEAGRHEEAAHLRLAEDELVVRGEPLGAVDQLLDPRVVHRRHAVHRPRADLLEARPVGGEQLAVEVGRDAVERPGGRVALVAAHHQATHLGAEVDQVVRVAQLGQVRRHALDRLGDQVLVREGDDRDGDPRHAPDLGGEHAGRVDHDLGGDLAAIRGHAGHAPTLDADSRHPRPRKDRRPAAPGAGGQRLGQPARVEVAVGRQPGGAEHAIGHHQREEALCLLGADQLHRQAVGLGPARLAAQLLHPLRARGKPQRADLAPARDRRPSRPPGRGRWRRCRPSSGSGSARIGAGPPGRRSGRSSRWSARTDRAGRGRSSPAPSGGRRSPRRRRRPR